MPMEIITADIGNTSTLFGYFAGGKLRKKVRIGTARLKTQAVRALRTQFSLKRAEALVIASVVPQAGRYLRKIVPQKLNLPAFLIGSDIPVPIKNKYRNPRQVGIDRLMNALAGFQKYHRPLIIVDFGTAITFDVVSGKGEYLGGVIAPGIEISLEALYQKTALLPRIKLAHSRGILGRDTAESIQAGCTYGIGGLCDRIIREIETQLRFQPFILATGGYAAFMSKYCRQIKAIDPDLTLKGILASYQAFKIRPAPIENHG